MKIEICVDNLASVHAAKAGGADRIELCSSLAEGGLTPSAGLMREAVSVFGNGVMVMLRPRGGDFCYSEGEMRILLEDLDIARAAGATGVVFGALNHDGTIDQKMLKRVLVAAKGMDFTFHRAFDVTRDLDEALDVLIKCGVPRVLTSGGEPNIISGQDVLARLIDKAGEQIIILPGGGVKSDMAGAFARAVGCREIHLSARHVVDSPMKFRRTDIRMGAERVPPEYVLKHVDVQQVREAVKAVK